MWASKIIKEKYINNRNEPLSFKKGFHIWKYIGVGWDTYKHSIAWLVGEGTNVNLWHDNWINGESLRSLIQGPLQQSELTLTTNVIRNCDITNISSINLPSELVDIVRSVVLSRNLDFTYSLWTDLGNFNSKIATRFLSPEGDEESWDWIWRSPGLPKHHFFLWQTWWNRMPTN